MLRKIVLFVFILIVLLILAVVAAALLIDPDDYRDELAERASQQLGREVRLEGPMDLSFFPWLALDIRDVTVGNPPGFDQAPPLAGIERATASVRVLPLLRGNVEVGTVTIERAGLHVVTARGGASNLEGLFAPAEPTDESGEPTDLSAIQTGKVRFENVVLSLIDLAAGSRTELQLDSLELGSFAAGQEVPLSLEGRLVEGSDTTLTLDFDGSVRVAADLGEVALSGWSLNYTLPTAGAEGEAAGSLMVKPTAEPLAIELSELTNRIELDGLVAELSADQPITASIGEVVRARLPAAELSLNGDSLSLDGEASIGETISGQLTVTGERLDLTRLAPTGDSDDASGDAPDQPTGRDDGAAGDFSALKMFDLGFSLDLGELVLVDGATLTEVTARSRLSEGKLTLDPLSAQLFGGQFQGSARVDFNQQPPAVVLTPELSGIHVDQLVSLLTGQSPVDGEGEFSMDLSFRGLSAEQMLGSLDGSGNFAVARGVLQGVDLQALIDEELTSDNLGNIARVFGGETQFQTLSGGLRIEDGVLELPSMDLAAAGYAATGQGRIDLGAGQVDYALALDLGEELTQKLPGALRRATDGRIPLSISGELAAPKVRVDLASLAEGVVREELGRRLMEALEDDDEEEQAPAPDGAPKEGDGSQTGAQETDEQDAEADKKERRREAARGLLKGLLERDEESESEKDSESGEPGESEEKQEETETEPPPQT